jgi:hypothetical protein
MPDKPLPSEEQILTVVSVRDGNISVTSARVLASTDTAIGVHIDMTKGEKPVYARAQPLTLLYTRGQRVLRLKAVVRDSMDDGRLTVEPVGDIKEGDRRDFRRANIKAPIALVAFETRDPRIAREDQLNKELADSDYSDVAFNLSGSGLQVASKRTWESGVLIDVRIKLPLPNPREVKILGEVVRMLGDSVEEQRLACRFTEISEGDQDLIVYTVFSRYFEDESLTDDLELSV